MSTAGLAQARTYDVETKLTMLGAAPAFLRELLAEVPAERLKAQLMAGKWTIHEHAVHLTMVDDIMTARLEKFRSEIAPVFHSYMPSVDEEAGALLKMDLQERLAGFEASRARLVEAFRALAPADWTKVAVHPEYLTYTPQFMLRHLVMHDHLHMYRIEELWQTRDEYLPKN